ncbi:uncharacterized protein EI90DRAFT_1919449 [Cantharellus anzutake]|uniref:uncharacterized protein n=1 Tax=Cantharellus anzutake TaxID=1750568 RepID=UPI001906A19F|nr:uncharacterized protein EI90DRAFT_1919449 [Cantharellus anzutake]KAF8326668.1 hypothetical protein EI90DRAFT_1919449 [Cantharellus anzutake]
MYTPPRKRCTSTPRRSEPTHPYVLLPLLYIIFDLLIRAPLAPHSGSLHVHVKYPELTHTHTLQDQGSGSAIPILAHVDSVRFGPDLDGFRSISCVSVWSGQLRKLGQIPVFAKAMACTVPSVAPTSVVVLYLPSMEMPALVVGRRPACALSSTNSLDHFWRVKTQTRTAPTSNDD